MTIRIRQVKWRTTCWLLAHIGLLVYAMRVPGTGLYVYRILYFSEALLLLLLGKGYKRYHTGKRMLRWTAFSWNYIAVQGAVVTLAGGRGGDRQELIWILCMPAVCFVLCYYAVDRDLYTEIFRAFIIVSVLLALFGIYESVTGHILNKTTGSYYYRRNMFRLTAPNTIFYNINDHAVFMTMSLFISWIWSEGRKNRKALRRIFLALYGFNVLMVGSYGALLSIVFFLLMQYLVISDNQKKRVRRLLIFLTIVLFVASFMLAGGFLSKNLGEDRAGIVPGHGP